MLIRSAVDQDFEPIAELVNHYIEHTPVHFATSPQTPDELRGAWKATRETNPFLVACDPSAPSGAGGSLAERRGFLGFAKGYRWRERDAYARTIELGIYIARHAQGRGIGGQLYQALIDECRSRGFHTAIGGVALPNPASERLHMRLGFARVGVFREVGRKFEAWHDVAFYQLML